MLKVPTPKYVKGLPTKIMTKGETEKMLNSIPVEEGNYFSYRDRLIMELLYSCSLRRGEVVALNVIDYDRSTKSLRIRANTSKSNQGRLLPVGSIASSILEYYIDHIHKNMHREALFLNYRKERLSVQHVTRLVTKLRKKLKLKTQATSHSFRKSSATHMLRNSAPLVSVSRLLGHTDISATQLYTKVYPVDIVKMQKAHHPREKQKNQKLPILKVSAFLYEQSNLTALKYSEKVFNFHKAILENHPREREELPILRPF